MTLSRDDRFQQLAEELQCRFDGEIRIGGNYTSAVENDGDVYVSG